MLVEAPLVVVVNVDERLFMRLNNFGRFIVCFMTKGARVIRVGLVHVVAAAASRRGPLLSGS